MTSELIQTGLLIALALAQTGRVLIARRTARRRLDPAEDRRNPPEYDPQRMWQIESDVQALKRRMEKAGAELSILGTKVQGMPTTLREDFLDLPMAHEWAQQCKGDRVNIHDELNRLRDDLSRLRESPWPKRIDRPR